MLLVLQAAAQTPALTRSGNPSKAISLVSYIASSVHAACHDLMRLKFQCG